MKSIPMRHIACAAFLLALVALVYLFSLRIPEAHASVPEAMEYAATTTNPSATAVRTLKSSYGSIAQVTITGANTGLITLYDATTSDATKRVKATSSLPVLADFPASTAAGTYTFDARFTDGLLLVSTGNTPTTTITYR